mgnify:CR=1 FL=1
MPAVANKPKPRSLCPLCYNAGIEQDLMSQGFFHCCNNGHKYTDREQLSQLVLEMNLKRRAAAPAPAPAPEAAPPADAAVTDHRVKIDDIDKERLQSIVGPFGDSATLFGAIFAMNESMKDLREQLERTAARVAAGQVRKIGGDYPMVYNVPERHVQPVKDVAEAGGMSIERYLQAQFDEALDNLWVY